VVHDAGARDRELAAEAKRAGMSFRTGVFEHVERLLMLHILNESVAVLRQMIAMPDLRPWQAYFELCRLAGKLSVFNADPRINPDRAVREYPSYDHNAIGPHFTLLCDHIRALLKALAVGTFEWRDFEPRPDREGLQVELKEEWLDGRREMFVGVLCGGLDESQLDATLKGIDWKIASADEVDMIFNTGDYGLELRPVRGVGGLPINPEIKYYKVHRDVNHWPKVEAGHVLAIRYSSGAQARLQELNIRFRVYVLMRNP
jgi:predicted component of type VI protein secretion system